MSTSMTCSPAALRTALLGKEPQSSPSQEELPFFVGIERVSLLNIPYEG